MDNHLLTSNNKEVTQINYTQIDETPFTMVEKDGQFAIIVTGKQIGRAHV